MRERRRIRREREERRRRRGRDARNDAHHSRNGEDAEWERIGSDGRSRPFATRLPRWLERELLEFARRMDLGPSQALRRVVEEWWAFDHHFCIEFRDDHLGRRAALRHGPDIWEVVRVQQEFPDLPGILEHAYPSLRKAELAAVRDYWRRFPDTVERFIIEYRRREIWDSMDHVRRLSVARANARHAARRSARGEEEEELDEAERLPAEHDFEHDSEHDSEEDIPRGEWSNGFL